MIFLPARLTPSCGWKYSDHQIRTDALNSDVVLSASVLQTSLYIRLTELPRAFQCRYTPLCGCTVIYVMLYHISGHYVVLTMKKAKGTKFLSAVLHVYVWDKFLKAEYAYMERYGQNLFQIASYILFFPLPTAREDVLPPTLSYTVWPRSALCPFTMRVYDFP